MKKKPALALVNATVFVVSECEGEVLLIRPRKRSRNWELPGGKIDRRESLPSGACREVSEETGIGIELGPLAAIYKCARQDSLMFVFLGRFRDGQIRPQPEEVREVRWAPIDSLEEMVDCGLNRQRIKDCLNYAGSPVYRSIQKRPFELYETLDLGLNPAPIMEIAPGEDGAEMGPSIPGPPLPSMVGQFWNSLRQLQFVRTVLR